MTTMYCPACGESSEIDVIVDLVPGAEIDFECPKCETKFTVRIEFKEPIE